MQIQEVKIMEQKYTVDARGEQCPIPVVKTKKVLDGIQGDAEITVLVDNETAVQNLTRMENMQVQKYFPRKNPTRNSRSSSV